MRVPALGIYYGDPSITYESSFPSRSRNQRANVSASGTRRAAGAAQMFRGGGGRQVKTLTLEKNPARMCAFALNTRRIECLAEAHGHAIIAINSYPRRPAWQI